MIQIFKSILGRKTRFLALFIEIVIVTVIGWIIFEPVAIETAKIFLPAGYDYDRLVRLKISSLDKESPEFDKSAETQDLRKDYSNLLNMVRQRPGVEKATYNSWQSFDMRGYSNNAINVDSSFFKKNGIDDLEAYMTSIQFLPNSDFFSTFGIKDVNGKPFQEPENDGMSYIISNTIAKAQFPDSSPIGKDLCKPSKWIPSSNIVGITSDVIYAKGNDRTAIYFEPMKFNENFRLEGITIRLGEGINPRTFIENLKSDLSEYRSGNLYLTHPIYMKDQREARFADKKRDITQKWIIVGFFLINVLLGVAGTFYVQCKTRIPDAGVMRAFGAPRHRVVWSIVGEAIVTTILGWLIGSILYLIYLKIQGSPMENDVVPVIRFLRPIWYDTKLGRYSVIGGLVLLLLLVTSAIGAWLPARKVGRVPIVESLRDE